MKHLAILLLASLVVLLGIDANAEANPVRALRARNAARPGIHPVRFAGRVAAAPFRFAGRVATAPFRAAAYRRSNFAVGNPYRYGVGFRFGSPLVGRSLYYNQNFGSPFVGNSFGYQQNLAFQQPFGYQQNFAFQQPLLGQQNYSYQQNLAGQPLVGSPGCAQAQSFNYNQQQLAYQQPLAQPQVAQPCQQQQQLTYQQQTYQQPIQYQQMQYADTAPVADPVPTCVCPQPSTFAPLVGGCGSAAALQANAFYGQSGQALIQQHYPSPIRNALFGRRYLVR